MEVRVLLVDDQPVVRAGFRTVVTADGFGVAADGPAAVHVFSHGPVPARPA